MKNYEMITYAADPFDLMCSDCNVNYIPVWEATTLDELEEMHAYLVIEDKYIPEQQKKQMLEDGLWSPTIEDFDEWLQDEINSGNVRCV